ncbi:GNAT family N-acetyltransferase [Paenibacillus spongiae]|uniref:GNAT family N-acetyltransferase n=1 Tax=Paenibacillus spongiae TaxID=2909671 RepID=A0ABY5SFN3_9BACL|nr:GNAT family N-acetyltransferase [Paenibacillus spongiae]UVI32786.1 GNAT family N-acetyltransferase [Paenibacillus spongiae]
MRTIRILRELDRPMLYIFHDPKRERSHGRSGKLLWGRSSIQLHERLGFKQEGRIRNMIYTNGQHYDE